MKPTCIYWVLNSPADALGKMLKSDEKNVPIVGVFRDFHAHPLNYKIAPMAIVRSADQNSRDAGFAAGRSYPLARHHRRT